jgi:chromosome segregation ATPase
MSENKKAPYLIAGNDVYYGHYPDDRCDDHEPNGYGGEVQCGKTAPYFYYALDSSRTSFQRSLHRACPYHLFTHPKFSHIGCEAERTLQERIAALESQLAAAQAQIAEAAKNLIWWKHEALRLNVELAAHVQTIRERDAEIEAFKAGRLVISTEFEPERVAREVELEKLAYDIAKAELRAEEAEQQLVALQQTIRERESEIARIRNESGTVERMSKELGLLKTELEATKSENERWKQRLAEHEKDRVKMEMAWRTEVQAGWLLTETIREREEQLAKILRYCSHDEMCFVGADHCDCGLSQIRAALDKPTAEGEKKLDSKLE